MKYFIWSDGEEHGPYEFVQLYESWKEGTLPQGFLWRRSDQSSFRVPDDLEKENADFRKTPEPGVSGENRIPQKGAEYLKAIRSASNYPITRMVLKICSIVALFFIGSSIWFSLSAIYGKAPREWDRYIDWVTAFSSMITGVALRIVYEFGTMIADHTDVQIDIGRGLHRIEN